MPVTVGDKGLTFAAGSVYATFTPVTTPAIGDTVILYNLGNGQRLAVPSLIFNLNDYSFVVPSFQFAGFNFHLDFNFNLLKFNLAAQSVDALLLVGQEISSDVVPETYEIFNGPLPFNWDGRTNIYLSGPQAGGAFLSWAQPAPRYIGIDDELTIYGPAGSIIVTPELGVTPWVPPFCINSILNPGPNTVQIFIKDIILGWHGTTDLYVRSYA
jgi:hypothetical protein